MKYRAIEDSKFNKALLFSAANYLYAERAHNSTAPELEDRCPWSFENACTGGGKTPSLARSASAGFPLYIKSRKKYDIFGKDGLFDFETPLARQLKLDYENLIKDIVDGIDFDEIVEKYQLYYSDFPKEETNGRLKCRNI